ncbi:hypothetical protein D3C78_1607570 [compost metagenome]
MLFDHLQDFGGQAAGDAHLFDVFGGFDGNGHYRLSTAQQGANNLGKGRILTEPCPIQAAMALIQPLYKGHSGANGRCVQKPVTFYGNSGFAWRASVV